MLPEWIWVYDKSYNFYFDTKKKKLKMISK